ncbi:MAG: hypothetical protein MMC33_009366 [Icmadophila ericetorum]|nr:hypothetical protein [Icmadophila ericetorum]
MVTNLCGGSPPTPGLGIASSASPTSLSSETTSSSVSSLAGFSSTSITAVLTTSTQGIASSTTPVISSSVPTPSSSSTTPISTTISALGNTPGGGSGTNDNQLTKAQIVGIAIALAGLLVALLTFIWAEWRYYRKHGYLWPPRPIPHAEAYEFTEGVNGHHGHV